MEDGEHKQILQHSDYWGEPVSNRLIIDFDPTFVSRVQSIVMVSIVLVCFL